jgi:hypothetical protein
MCRPHVLHHAHHIRNLAKNRIGRFRFRTVESAGFLSSRPDPCIRCSALPCGRCHGSTCIVPETEADIHGPRRGYEDRVQRGPPWRTLRCPQCEFMALDAQCSFMPAVAGSAVAGLNRPMWSRLITNAGIQRPSAIAFQPRRLAGSAGRPMKPRAQCGRRDVQDRLSAVPSRRSSPGLSRRSGQESLLRTAGTNPPCTPCSGGG